MQVSFLNERCETLEMCAWRRFVSTYIMSNACMGWLRLVGYVSAPHLPMRHVWTRLRRHYGEARLVCCQKWIIGLFCKRDLYKRRYSATETHAFKEPTNHSQPIITSWYGREGSWAGDLKINILQISHKTPPQICFRYLSLQRIV